MFLFIASSTLSANSLKTRAAHLSIVLRTKMILEIFYQQGWCEHLSKQTLAWGLEQGLVPKLNPWLLVCGKMRSRRRDHNKGLAGVVNRCWEAQNSGYLPAGVGIFTIFTTDTSIPVCTAGYQLCWVKCAIQKRHSMIFVYWLDE